MSTITPNMGLTKWDLSSDPYDHGQLAANFTAIDLHDHSAGKGVKIGSGGILNGAIINALLAPNSVDSSKIIDGTITMVDLSQAVTDALCPLGSIKAWWRPSGGIPVPTGFVIAMGQTLNASQHDFSGGGSIVVPDLRNRFLLGADTSGTGSGTGTPPSIGLLSGAHTTDLRHTHTVNSHTHTIDGHSHTVGSHAHQVSAHSHSISTAGDHVHRWWNGVDWKPLSQRAGATSVGSTFQAAYIKSLNAGIDGSGTSVDADMEQQGDHNHSGDTGNASPWTDSQTPPTNSVGLTTNGTSTGTSNPSVDLSAVDKRPAYAGVLFIVKVKY